MTEECVDTILEYPVMVEIVHQKIVVFENIRADEDRAGLVKRAFEKGLLKTDDAVPVYLNVAEAAEVADHDPGWTDVSEWEDVWPWKAPEELPVQRIDMKGKPDPVHLTVTCENPCGLSEQELREELAIRLMASDGEQHLETMNRVPEEGVFFTVEPERKKRN